MPIVSRRQFLRLSAGAAVAGGVTLAGHAQDRPADSDLVTADAQAAIDRGLSFLANTQAADGSFPDTRTSVGLGNVAVTGLAGLAFLAGGHQPGRGRHGAAVGRATDYVVGRAATARPAGYLTNADQFPDQPFRQSSMYQHGFGTLFLSEVAGMSPDRARQDRVRATLERAVGLIRSAQNSDGGWRYEPRPTPQADVSVTVAQLMALRAAKNAGVTVPKSVVDKSVKYIKDCQLPGGGFCYIRGQRDGPDFNRSAAAVVGLFSAGVYDGPEIDKGLRYLLRFTPGRPFNTGEARPQYYFYGQYYAALAMWTAGGNYWAEWFPAIRDELLAKARQASGVWADFAHGPAYATAMACIILQLPNNYLPIMQK